MMGGFQAYADDAPFCNMGSVAIGTPTCSSLGTYCGVATL